MAVALDAADVRERLRQVREHALELRRSGRLDDAEAVSLVSDLAEQMLAQQARVARRELLTTGQAALALGISDQTVRNWVVAGRLPAVKRGVRTMIPRAAITAEIEQSRVRAPAEDAPPGDEAIQHIWRKALLDALPQSVVARLDELHVKFEDGQALTLAEQHEMKRLEREMADAAARHLRNSLRAERPSAP